MGRCFVCLTILLAAGSILATQNANATSLYKRVKNAGKRAGYSHGRKCVHGRARSAGKHANTQNEKSRDALGSDKKGHSGRTIATEEGRALYHSKQTMRIPGETDTQYLDRMFSSLKPKSGGDCASYTKDYLQELGYLDHRPSGNAGDLPEKLLDSSHFRQLTDEEVAAPGDVGYSSHGKETGHIFVFTSQGQISDFASDRLPGGGYSAPVFYRHIP